MQLRYRVIDNYARGIGDCCDLRFRCKIHLLNNFMFSKSYNKERYENSLFIFEDTLRIEREKIDAEKYLARIIHFLSMILLYNEIINNYDALIGELIADGKIIEYCGI